MRSRRSRPNSSKHYARAQRSAAAHGSAPMRVSGGLGVGRGTNVTYIVAEADVVDAHLIEHVNQRIARIQPTIAHHYTLSQINTRPTNRGSAHSERIDEPVPAWSSGVGAPSVSPATIVNVSGFAASRVLRSALTRA